MTELVAKMLGAIVLVGVVGVVILACLQRTIPDPLALITTGGLTGLLGLLAQSPLTSTGRRRADTPG